MPSFSRRFRRAAGVALLVAVVAFAAIITVGCVLISMGDAAAGLTAFGVAFAFVATAVVLVIMSYPRVRALRQVRAVNPDGAVFLARRQPSVVADLATYLNDAELYDQVSDRWLVASIDDRGLAAWSIERRSRELVLMPWHVVASVEPISLENGRPGVAVDVRPFPTPLVVSVGYAAFGILASIGRRGVAEIVETANALRPPVVE